MSIEWYAVHTYVGHEDKVRENILNRARSLGATDNIYQVVVPKEEIVERGSGNKDEVVKRMLFPGYIFVHATTRATRTAATRPRSCRFASTARTSASTRCTAR